MNFRPRPKEEPEINLIPFIDVLLVILIFLMLTTTYSKFTELQLKLPVADTDAQRDYPKEIIDFGDTILVTAELSGHGRGSGIAVSEPTFQLFKIERGSIPIASGPSSELICRIRVNC